MTYHHDIGITCRVDLADHTIEDATRFGTRLSLQVQTLTAEVHITQTFHNIGTKATYDLVGTDDRHGQTPLIARKTA